MYGQEIKKILKKRNLTQRDLAGMIGIKESLLSKYLSTDKPLRVDIICKIARSLNVDLYSLINFNNDNKHGDTFNICKTALLARSGNKLSDNEKKELISLIFDHE